jgi:hypothetical protein
VPNNRIDGALVQWGDRLFYPGNRIVRSPTFVLSSAALHGSERSGACLGVASRAQCRWPGAALSGPTAGSQLIATAPGSSVRARRRCRCKRWPR